MLLIVLFSCLFWMICVRPTPGTYRDAIFKTVDNLVDGVLVSVVTVLCVRVWLWVWMLIERKKLLEFFGNEIVDGKVFVVFPDFLCIGSGSFKKHPLPDGQPPITVDHFESDRAVAKADIRGVGYLMQFLGKIGNTAALMVSDTDQDCEIFRNDEASFIAVGMWTNLCFHKIRQISGGLFSLSGDTVEVTLKGSKPFRKDEHNDYGLIVKLRPPSRPNTSWFLCAGTGEQGTADGAWFLANRWTQLYERFGASSFAAVVRVSRGRDKSAVFVDGKKWQE